MYIYIYTCIHNMDEYIYNFLHNHLEFEAS